jgi:predicted outer membrane protein
MIDPIYEKNTRVNRHMALDPLFGSVAPAVTLTAFLEEVARQSAFQTESAKVALQKSKSPEVKDLPCR